MGSRYARMFVALMQATERRLGDLSAQDLANAAWAFTTASQRYVAFFVALAWVAERRLVVFGAQYLATTA